MFVRARTQNDVVLSRLNTLSLILDPGKAVVLWSRTAIAPELALAR